MVAQTLSRRTDAFSASRDLSAARVAWARPSWKNPSAALKTRSTAMIAASTYLPRTSSSTIAASSIQGTGAQSLVSARRNGCRAVSGTAFGPNCSSRRRASSLVRPVERGKSLTDDCGVIEAFIPAGDHCVPVLVALSSCIVKRDLETVPASSFKRPVRAP